MSKFFNALAVAVLGIALLMGAASAGDTTVNGCVLPAANTVAFTVNPTGTVNLGNLPNTAAGGSLSVMSNATGNWKVTVDGSDDGKMKGPGNNLLGQNFKVNTVALGASATDLITSSGPSVGCAASSIAALTYAQGLNTADNAYPGAYTITLTYTAAPVA